MKLKNILSPEILMINIFTAAILFSSCNKTLPEAEPITYPPVNNESTSIGDVISQDTSYSFFAAAAKKTGQLALLSNAYSVLTVFLPDNNAFRASGIPSLTVVNALPVATLGGIVGYAIIPGEQFLSGDFENVFPNKQLPTTITIGTLPGTPIPLKLSTFPSKTSTGFYDNNIPVIKPDIKCRNGVIHVVGAIVAPPSVLLKDAIYNNPDLSYFKAAIARADSGQTGLSRLDSLLGYGVTNMTVLVPNNAAFQTAITGLAYSYLLSVAQNASDSAQALPIAMQLAATPNVFQNPALYGVVTAEMVRGIIAYHFLATDAGAGYQPNIRVFSNNFSSTPKTYTTLVNGAFAQHPGILAAPVFSGPMVSDLHFTGLGTFPPGGAPYSGAPANVLSKDNHAVNGVYYVIDQVLLPQ